MTYDEPASPDVSKNKPKSKPRGRPKKTKGKEGTSVPVSTAHSPAADPQNTGDGVETCQFLIACIRFTKEGRGMYMATGPSPGSAHIKDEYCCDNPNCESSTGTDTDAFEAMEAEKQHRGEQLRPSREKTKARFPKTEPGVEVQTEEGAALEKVGPPMKLEKHEGKGGRVVKEEGRAKSGGDTKAKTGPEENGEAKVQTGPKEPKKRQRKRKNPPTPATEGTEPDEEMGEAGEVLPAGNTDEQGLPPVEAGAEFHPGFSKAGEVPVGAEEKVDGGKGKTQGGRKNRGNKQRAKKAKPDDEQ